MDKRIIEKNTIFETVVGSQAYGTALPESDEDFRGILFSPKEFIYGIDSFEQSQSFGDLDKQMYELRFAFSLMAKGNPNMLDLLYVPKKFWIKTTKYWDSVVENRDMFLSRKIKNSYVGYAISQLRRIESHKKWLLNPVLDKPKRSDFGLSSDSKTIPKDQLKALLTIKPEFIREEIQDEALHERAYSFKKKEYDAFVSWEKNRNPARAELERRCGYDAKHAMHLIRLSRQGKEILETGEVFVDRTGIDADYLMKIRKGEVPWEDIEEEVSRMGMEFNALCLKSPLPKDVDRTKINELVIELYNEFHRGVV